MGKTGIINRFSLLFPPMPFYYVKEFEPPSFYFVKRDTGDSAKGFGRREGRAGGKLVDGIKRVG
jgi:hypothetical protein